MDNETDEGLNKITNNIEMFVVASINICEKNINSLILINFYGFDAVW